MNDDITTRLDTESCELCNDIAVEAADEIKQLRAKLDARELVIKMLRANAAEQQRRAVRRG